MSAQAGMIFPLKVGQASDKQRHERGQRNIVNSTGWTIARDVVAADAYFITETVNNHVDVRLEQVKEKLEHLAKYGRNCDVSFIANDALRILGGGK